MVGKPRASRGTEKDVRSISGAGGDKCTQGCDLQTGKVATAKPSNNI